MPNNFKMMIIIVGGVFVFIMGMAIVIWVSNSQVEKEIAEENANIANTNGAVNTSVPANTNRKPGVIY